MTRRSRVATLVVACALTAGACGGGGANKAVAPQRVPVQIVPATLGGGAMSLKEDPTAHKKFANAGDAALVADGRLWAVRQGDKLVATLQVSTLKTKVDLANEAQREAIIGRLLVGNKERIRVHRVPVVRTTSGSDNKTVYLWFGRSMFQVLLVKGVAVDAEAILGDLITYETAQRAWKPLDIAAK